MSEHTSPASRLWVTHILRCAEGCTIAAGGNAHCPEGARLYCEMRSEGVTQ